MSDPHRDAPRVSVVASAYNHEGFIREALAGVLSQRVEGGFEVILGEDCSTDRTRDIVLELAAERPDVIRLVLPERNLGPNELFARCLPLVRGTYVALLDGDDLWTSPLKLQAQLEILDAHPECSSCFHNATVFYDDGSAPSRDYTPAFGRRFFDLRDLLRSSFIATSSLMYRHALLPDWPSWCWAYPYSDWLMEILLAQRGRIAYIDEHLGAYRMHSGSSFSSRARADQIREDIRMYRDLPGILGPGHETPIRAGMLDRYCQLAVESAGLVRDVAVLVVARDLSTVPYLNERPAWWFPLTDDGASVTPDRLRDAWRRGARYLMCSRVELHRLRAEVALCRYLENDCVLVHHDEHCRIYALSPLDLAVWSAGSSIVASGVRRLEPLDQALEGWHLDVPEPGSRVDGATLTLRGWVLGRDAAVVAAEAVDDGGSVRRTRLGGVRPDLAAAFPGSPWADRAGFHLEVPVLGSTDLEVRAVLADRRRVPLGRLQVERKAHDPAAGSVAVVIPCFNQSQFLGAAIASALRQSHPPTEIVVIDDGSSDNAAEVARGFPGVRCFRQPNSGLSAARNAGIAATTAEFLVFLDSDDLLLPHALETGLALLRRHPDCAFVSGHYRHIGVDGHPTATTPEQPVVVDHHYRHLLEVNLVGTPAAAIYRRGPLLSVGGFDESLVSCEDYDLHLRVARRYPVRCHDAVVAEYRQHAAGMSRQPQRMLASALRVLAGQRRYALRSRDTRQAYRTGRAFWRAYYGRPVRSLVKTALLESRRRDALSGLMSLVVLDPRGAAVLMADAGRLARWSAKVFGPRGSLPPSP